MHEDSKLFINSNPFRLLALFAQDSSAWNDSRISEPVSGSVTLLHSWRRLNPDPESHPTPAITFPPCRYFTAFEDTIEKKLALGPGLNS